jgi:excinuclease ABC subunit B
VGIKNNYIHSDIDTLDRIKILEDLREGRIDVIVGVNLLREGIDLPEVSLVMILDADKEGFLRNVRSLTQVIGRAARHITGLAVLYADKMTDSMREVIRQSIHRRAKQVEFNFENDVTPRSAKKSSSEPNSLLTISDALESERGSESRRNRGGSTSYRSHSESHFEDVGDSINNILGEIGGGSGTMAAEGLSSYSTEAPEESVLEQNIDALIAEMRSKMESAAKTLDFQNAARYRDRMYELQKLRDNLKK